MDQGTSGGNPRIVWVGRISELLSFHGQGYFPPAQAAPNPIPHRSRSQAGREPLPGAGKHKIPSLSFPGRRFLSRRISLGSEPPRSWCCQELVNSPFCCLVAPELCKQSLVPAAASGWLCCCLPSPASSWERALESPGAVRRHQSSSSSQSPAPLGGVGHSRVGFGRADGLTG